MQAKNLSLVSGSSLSRKSIKADNATVPIIDLIKKLFPILKIENKNKGTLIINIMVPIGILNK